MKTNEEKKQKLFNLKMLLVKEYRNGCLNKREIMII